MKKDIHLDPEWILTDHFEENLSTQIIFKNRDGKVLVKNIKKLVNNKKFINKLSSSDAYLIGYLVGTSLKY